MGLNLTLQAIFAQLRNVQLMLLALALNFILAPAFAWLLTVVIPLQHGHAIGILLLGAAAGAPFLPTLVETARGDLAAATSLMVLLTLGTILFMPFAVPLLIPGLRADTWSIARPLVIFIVLPMIVGMLIKPYDPRLAGRAAPVLAKVGNICLLLFFVLLIALNIRALLGVVGSGAIAAALFYVVGLFVSGWLLGGPKTEVRSVIALGTAGRNFGAALVPTATSFHDPTITMMLIVSAIIGITILFLTASWLRGKMGRFRTTRKDAAGA
jgi:BASS family bile acid:Na+ symporter